MLFAIERQMPVLRSFQLLNLPVRIILFLIAVLSFLASTAQIVDDSTQVVYGPKTTLFTYESAILNNQVTYQRVDTSIYKFERQSLYNRTNRRLQDLGNFGTANTPIFFAPQETIGRTSGFNAYRRFAIAPEDIKYYDTKSPFIELLVFLGGGNRNLVNVGFSRNVNENWNLGFNLNKITSNKQLAPTNQTDRQVVGTSFVGYTHYKHKTLPYQILANYSNMNHKVAEIGGARPTTDSLRSDFFLFDNVLVRLEDAVSTTKNTNIHAYQDFQIADQFQLYHVFDYKKEINEYQDFAGSVGPGDYDLYSDFYGEFLIDEDTTYEQSTFSSLSNEVGLKGDLSAVFYRFYAKTRSIKWKYLFFNPGEDFVETYVGGYVRFNWKEKFKVTADAEYLLGGEYQFGGNLTSDLIDVSYKSSQIAVPFIYSDYFGNHHEWHNDFKPVFANKLDGQVKLDFDMFEIRPKASVTAYTNFIYLDENIDPQQSRDLFISSIGGDFNLRFFNSKGEGWHLENEVLATNVSGTAADYARVPDLYLNGRYFWRGNWFKDLIPVEFGIDAHARSSYFANAFAPEIQQFYVQNEQEVFGDFAADLFVNMKIGKFFLAMKWTYANQSQDDGYLVTPNYPGQRRVIDILVRWMFFD